jgi:hypothetical protein
MGRNETVTSSACMWTSEDHVRSTHAGYFQRAAPQDCLSTKLSFCCSVSKGFRWMSLVPRSWTPDFSSQRQVATALLSMRKSETKKGK